MIRPRRLEAGPVDLHSSHRPGCELGRGDVKHRPGHALPTSPSLAALPASLESPNDRVIGSLITFQRRTIIY